MNVLKIAASSVMAFSFACICDAAFAATYECDEAEEVARLSIANGYSVSVVGYNGECEFTVNGGLPPSQAKLDDQVDPNKTQVEVLNAYISPQWGAYDADLTYEEVQTRTLQEVKAQLQILLLGPYAGKRLNWEKTVPEYEARFSEFGRQVARCMRTFHESGGKTADQFRSSDAACVMINHNSEYRFGGVRLNASELTLCLGFKLGEGFATLFVPQRLMWNGLSGFQLEQ